MKDNIIVEKINCRACNSKELVKVFDFGPTPLANSFLNKNQTNKEENYFPLQVNFCKNCSFLQLSHVISPRLLFSEYVYLSSTSNVFINHFINFSKTIIDKFDINNNSFVVDIGSNDGILLKPLKEKGIRVLGIEPAKKIAKLARNKGIETISDYFSVRTVKKIIKDYGKADIVTCTNVFAHINDLDEVIKGIKLLMKENGVFIIEVPYLVDFIEKKYFDLVYHEHLSYWRVKTLKTLFSRFNMSMIRVEKVAAHGGSIRVYIKRSRDNLKIEKNVSKFIITEEEKKLGNKKTYLDFALKVDKNRYKLLKILIDLKSSGKKIVGYGAPAKGNTLLNYFNIGTNIIDYIIDDSTWKQGLFTPGKRIPVKNFSYLRYQDIDYILILAWNFSSSIIIKNRLFHNKGGKFIIPVPKPKII